MDKNMEMLILAIQAADETFGDDDKKFREFVRKLLKPRIATNIQGLPPLSSGEQNIRYGIPM